MTEEQQNVRWTVEPTSWGSFQLRDSVTGRAGFSSKDRGDLEQLATTLNVQCNAASVAYRRKENLIAAALAWRETEKRYLAETKADYSGQLVCGTGMLLTDLTDRLRLACDRYMEAQEK